MKILIAGFEGKNNSSKIILDYIKEKSKEDILYLKNDFNICKKQIEEKLINQYDYVLLFGQKTDTKNIYLENNATIGETKLTTLQIKSPQR